MTRWALRDFVTDLLGLDEQYPGEGRPPGSANDSGGRVSACADDEARVMDAGERVLPEHHATVLQALELAAYPWRFGADPS